MKSTENVPEHIAPLMKKLAGGWSPTSMEIDDPVTLTWRGRDLSAFKTTEIKTVGDKLHLNCVGDATAENFDWLNVAGLQKTADNNKGLSGITRRGLRIQAEHCAAVNSGFRSREGSVWFDLVARYWHAMIDGTTPAVWIGRVSVRLGHNAGNLRVGIGHNGLRLEGAYIYYLIPDPSDEGTGSLWLVVDTGGQETPRRDKMYQDFLTLQFVLGQRACLNSMIGVSVEGTVCGEIGGRFGDEHPPGARTAIPVPFLWSRETWMAPLFRRISETYRQKPELRLYIPLGYFVDALTDHLDGAYLKIQVALEAFAASVLGIGKDENAVIVKDWGAWTAWVKSQREEIRAFAVDGREETLFSKVMYAGKFASGRVVRDAFEMFGVKISKEMKDELLGRNLAAHSALMTTTEDRDYEQDLRRIALVRTMIVALLARVVGYQGPIIGWTRDQNGQFEVAPSDWWQFQEDDRAEADRVYIA